MGGEADFFERVFYRLKGCEPFNWQRRLFQLFLRGTLPAKVNIPTACGKTAIMHIWVAALGWQALSGPTPSLPRRLVWIVDRRVVVDQATSEAELIAEKLERDEGLVDLRDALRSLSYSGRTLFISTLRGGRAEDPEWKKDPSTPAILVGTVNMLGSKMLFCGYGDGKGLRPHHAGLLLNDALIVHDEAHLTPSFYKLLEKLKELQANPLRPLHFMHLSALLRERGEDFGLKEGEDEDLKERIEAKKYLKLHPSPSEEIVERMAELALERKEMGKRVLVYVWSPRDAEKIVNRLKRAGVKVLLLTGEIRGWERDQLVQSEDFKVFFQHSPPPLEASLYLVSTSAGEVGVDISADECVCQLVEVDHLAQLLGRVNRFGKVEANVDLVYDEELESGGGEKKNHAILSTLHYLKRLPSLPQGIDVSPKAFQRFPPPQEAFSEEPFSPQLTPFELDVWSMTSVPHPTMPDPQFWLHGSEENVPETYFVWRRDVRWLASEGVEEKEVKEVLKSFPILPCEVLRVDTERAYKFLEKKGKENPEARVIVLDRAGRLARKNLGKIERRGLEYATILLPSELGGLSEEGFLNPDRKEGVQDVAESGGGERYHLKCGDEGWILTKLGGEEKIFKEDPRESLRGEKRGMLMLEVEIRGEGEEAREWLIYFSSRFDPSLEYSKEEQPLWKHAEKVARVAGELAVKVGFHDLAEAFHLAGKLHDTGKGRVIWQMAIGNPNPSEPLAKSGRRRFDYALCRNYRHEFGSLLDAKRMVEGPWKDLILHLISSSHGYARPVFPSDLTDPEYPEESEEAYWECAERFVRLQGRLGWWNLAYMEAILKAADWMVSEGRV